MASLHSKSKLFNKKLNFSAFLLRIGQFDYIYLELKIFSSKTSKHTVDTKVFFSLSTTLSCKIIFLLFYPYIYSPDLQESNAGANK